MDSHFSVFNKKKDKPLTSEQYHQIFTAILEGKYSWACILLLRFTHQNPLDYIPERTYYRLVIKNKSSHAHLKFKDEFESYSQYK